MARADTPIEHAEFTLDFLRDVSARNAREIEHAAQRMLDCVRSDGLVYTAGAGHSLGGVLESFYRAGGLAAVRPLYHPDLFPLHSARASSAAERQAGLAAEVLHTAEFHAGRDVLVVFSNSGVNPYPVELARTARAGGSFVLAVTSPAVGASAPRRADGVLADHADLVLDTRVPAGDASYPRDAPVTAPLSTLANGFVWNLVLTRIHDLARQAEVPLPVWHSVNTADGDTANEPRWEQYGPRIPELGQPGQ